MLCDLYVRWTRLCPNKTDSPLIINPYAVLSRSIPGQRLKSVSRRRLQVLECRSRIKHPEFSRRKLTNRSKLLGPVRFKEFLCIGALEPLNCHASNCIPFTGMQQGSAWPPKTDSSPTGIIEHALNFASISAIADMDGVVLLAPTRPPVCHRSVSWRTREGACVPVLLAHVNARRCTASHRVAKTLAGTAGTRMG